MEKKELSTWTQVMLCVLTVLALMGIITTVVEPLIKQAYVSNGFFVYENKIYKVERGWIK